MRLWIDYTDLKKLPEIFQREKIFLVSISDRPFENRIANSFRHNQSRGTDSIELMMNNVKQLIDFDATNRSISYEFGLKKKNL